MFGKTGAGACKMLHLKISIRNDKAEGSVSLAGKTAERKNEKFTDSVLLNEYEFLTS